MVHLPLQPRCGACADTIYRHERVVAVSRTQRSETYECTRPFAFPQPNMVPTMVEGRYLCRHPNCSQCKDAPEIVTLHYDCYKIFMHYSKLEEHHALARVWTVGTWRSLWPKAPLIHLTRKPNDWGKLSEFAEICGIAQVCQLPAEIIDMIWARCPHELFWRAIATATAAAIPPSGASEVLRIPLGTVLSWERGGQLVQASSESSPSHIRLTADLEGICKIERLTQRPPYSGCGVSERLAFILEHVQDVTDIEAEYKDGLLRLCFPLGQQPPSVWNSASPPDPMTCTFRSSTGALSGRHLHIVDPNRILGLTFLFSSGQLFGIHAHRSDEASAKDTYERLPNRRRQGTAWVYLPIAPDDRVLVLGTRETKLGFSILIRMQLVGDVILGPSAEPVEPDRLLGCGDSLVMLYGEPGALYPISIFGAYCGRPATNSRPRPFLNLKSDPSQVYTSWASLSGIQSATTFYDEGTKLCKGVLFRYEDGGLRALGQCRLNIDPTTVSLQPSWFCFQATTYLTSLRKRERNGVRVEIGLSTPHRHLGDGWNCLPLTGGILTFSFTHDSSSINLSED